MGTKATPSPAATKPSAVGYSSASMAYTGLNPAWVQADSMTNSQELGNELIPIQRSEAKSREVDRVLRGQRMRTGQHDAEGISQQMPMHEIVVGGVTGRHRLHCDENVNGPAAQAHDTVVALKGHEVEGDIRVQGLEGGEGAGHEGGAGGGTLPAGSGRCDRRSATRASSASCIEARTRAACSHNSMAASVGRTPLPTRSKSCTPVSRSSALICWLTAEGE